MRLSCSFLAAQTPPGIFTSSTEPYEPLPSSFPEGITLGTMKGCRPGVLTTILCLLAMSSRPAENVRGEAFNSFAHAQNPLLKGIKKVKTRVSIMPACSYIYD